MFCSDLTETVDWASNTNDDAPLYQVWSQNVQNFRWLFCLRIWTYSVTLTLKIRTQTCQMTIPVMTMHQHTKFHSERLCGTWFRIYCRDTFSQRIWTLTVTLTLSTAVPNCHKTPRLMMMHHYIIIIPNLVAKSLEVQGIWKKQLFLRIWANTVTLTLRSEPNFFPQHSGSWWCTTIPSFDHEEGFKWFRGYRPDKCSWRIWSPIVTLIL